MNLSERYEKCTLSAIIHFAVIADWISSKNDREAGAGATPKLEILSTKITSSFMSRDLHQQTLDLFLNLARQGERAECIAWIRNVEPSKFEIYFLAADKVCTILGYQTKGCGS